MRVSLINWAVLVCGVGLCVAGLLLLLSRPQPVAEPPAKAPPTEITAEALIAASNCNFCHRTDVGTLVEHPRANCQHCHQKEHVPEYLAPPLATFGARRPGAWLRRYLRHPYPLRTYSVHRMPDMGLSDAEIDTLVRWFERTQPAAGGPVRDQAQDAARIASARKLWDKFSCGVCHDLGAEGASFHASPEAQPGPEHLNAPPLTLAWTRLNPGWVADAIHKPSQVMPWSGMLEHPNMTRAEAEELAWFVFNAVPQPEQTVRADEVMRVLKLRCSGCHYGPSADPANTPLPTNPAGGASWLGYWGKPRKLDLMTLEGVMLGALDDRGERRPVVVPYAPNAPIIEYLRGRKQPRMPFGHDPLPEDETALIERWVMEGARK